MQINQRISTILFLISSAVLLTDAALANDASFGDDNGTIVFKYQPDISMDRESLSLSEEKVVVEYLFTNHSKEDITIPIAFPMPPMFFEEMDHTSISDFKLWVNDKYVKTTRELVILLDENEDITASVEELGWYEEALIKFLYTGNKPDELPPLPAEWFDKFNRPRFTLNEYFTWSQHFPSGQPVKIGHSYTPSISTGIRLPIEYIMEDFGKSTCIDPHTKKGIIKRSTELGVQWAELSYILKTAKNWQGPIKDFSLEINKSSPTDLISLCFDGDLKKTDAVTFEFHQKNYRPEQDLRILFIK